VLRFLVAAAILAFILVAMETQIIGIQNDRRKDECKTVAYNGIVHKASDYEYYSCLNGG